MDSQDITKQIISGEKKLKVMTEKEMELRTIIQKLQEDRKALDARLGLMRIEANMARDGAMRTAVQEQIQQLVQKLKNNSEEIKKNTRELESILGFREQLQEAIGAQKRQNFDASQLAETEIKSNEYDQVLDQIGKLADEFNQLKELILNRFEELRMLNRRSVELKYEIDKLRGIPDVKKQPGHITNFVSQTITIPYFDIDEKLLKLDPLTKY